MRNLTLLTLLQQVILNVLLCIILNYQGKNEQVFCRYVQRWAKDYLRRRLDWTVDEEGGNPSSPRHLASALCPCQYIEEWLRNKPRVQGRDFCPRWSSFLRDRGIWEIYRSFHVIKSYTCGFTIARAQKEIAEVSWIIKYARRRITIRINSFRKLLFTYQFASSSNFTP